MLVGDWRQIENYLANLPKEVDRGSEDLSKMIAIEMKDTMVRILMTNRVSGPPLRPDTVDEKVRKGQSTNKLIASGGMVRSINTFKIGDKRYHVGPSEAYKDIANYQEYGTDEIPARPFTADTEKIVNKKIPQMIQDQGFEYRGKS